MCVFVLALLSGRGALAAPAEPCPPLFVPDGYRLTCEIFGDPEREWRLTVRPEGELISPLSVLTLRPVEKPVDDPDIWLREQLTLNLSDIGGAFRNFLARPDSPLFDPVLTHSLDQMIGQLRLLDQLPLQSCGFPAMTARQDAWQIDCDWGLGPIQIHGVLRLAYRDDQPYAISVWAMNERRMRHLVAIANSF